MKAYLSITIAMASLFGVSFANAQSTEVAPQRVDSRPDSDKIGFRYWHADVGLGIRAGGGARVVEAQAYVGAFWARKIHVPGWSPFVALGVHLGAGQVYVDDPRGIDGVVDVNRFDVGPEFRFGVARGDKIEMFQRAWPNVQFFMTSAFTSVHAGTLSTQLPEAGHGWAARVGAGMSLPVIWSRITKEDPVTLLLFLFPNTYVFDMEIPIGEPDRIRYGVRLNFGF